MAIVILDDRPVDADGDLLWKSLPIRRELERIAETIVRSKEDPLSSSMTFAVHGKWGTGKSSALKMLRSFVQERSEAAGKRPVFCEYQAPALQASRRDARTTLAMRILQSIAMAGDARKISQRLEDYARIIDRERTEGMTSAEGATAETVWDAAMFDRISAVLTSIPDLCGIIIRQELASCEKGPRLLVVLLDDLDRCGSDFVLSLLQEIQYLSDIDNLFFVMAVDEEILRSAVRSQGGGKSVMETDRELEKYLQHAVWVPTLDGARAKEYVKGLAERAPRVKKLVEPLWPQDDTREAFDLLLEGLHEMTPRSVKRYLNLLAPKIDGALEVRAVHPSDVLGKRAIFKEKMIETTWPDFHRNVLAKAVGEASSKGDPKAVNLVAELEGIGRDARERNAPDTKVLHDLKYVCEEYPHMGLGEVPVKLVRYLAIAPPLPYLWLTEIDPLKSISLEEPRTLPEVDPGSGLADDEEEEAAAKSLDPAGTEKPATRGARALSLEPAGPPVKEEDSADDGTGPPNPLRQFQGIYLSIGKTFARDQQRALQNAQRAYDLVQSNRVRFDRRHVNRLIEIANAIASTNNHSIASKLCELALELGPEIMEAAQNYLDLIVRLQIAELYPRAGELVQRLRSSGTDPCPERTLYYELRLGNAQGSLAGVDEERLRSAINDFKRMAGDGLRYLWLMRALAQVGDRKLAREVTKAHYHAVLGADAVTALFRMASLDAASPDVNDEREALELYRYAFWTHRANLIRGGTAPGRGLQRGLHEYAALLFKHEYEQAAGEAWFRAYQRGRGSEDIRREYSAYLMRANAPDLARKVSNGEPIDRMVTLAKRKELPASFVGPDVERWWEKEHTEGDDLEAGLEDDFPQGSRS
ncbi:P-loop NTPase fold protein [Sorangium sp. So ce1014]|uniref:P-loop NTPase fold protein n=1 Tax=Sorangium sp. So ce1014 TaxID=3133326 RepID=UPI003F601955